MLVTSNISSSQYYQIVSSSSIVSYFILSRGDLFTIMSLYSPSFFLRVANPTYLTNNLEVKFLLTPKSIRVFVLYLLTIILIRKTTINARAFVIMLNSLQSLIPRESILFSNSFIIRANSRSIISCSRYLQLFISQLVIRYPPRILILVIID